MGNFYRYVFRVFSKNEFLKFKCSKKFEGNQFDIDSGFIHLSTMSQLEGTVEKYFKNERELSIVKFKTKDLESFLRWEKSRDSDLFPHFYGVLKFEWVKNVKKRLNL
tara:strand:- start:660 stop:980 length:321 start_codon:yes stop_codon:yes gene_type:complete